MAKIGRSLFTGALGSLDLFSRKTNHQPKASAMINQEYAASAQHNPKA